MVKYTKYTNLEVSGEMKTSGASLSDARNSFTITPHDYDTKAVDWVLSAEQLKMTVFKPTKASAAVNAIIGNAAGLPYIFINGTGQALTVKTAAGTGVAIANGKTCIVMSDGTNVIALAGVSA